MRTRQAGVEFECILTGDGLYPSPVTRRAQRCRIGLWRGAPACFTTGWVVQVCEMVTPAGRGQSGLYRGSLEWSLRVTLIAVLIMVHQSGFSKWSLGVVPQIGLLESSLRVVHQSGLSEWSLEVISRTGFLEWSLNGLRMVSRSGLSKWSLTVIFYRTCMCMCARAHACQCMCACARVCACVCVWMCPCVCACTCACGRRACLFVRAYPHSNERR